MYSAQSTYEIMKNTSIPPAHAPKSMTEYLITNFLVKYATTDPIPKQTIKNTIHSH